MSGDTILSTTGKPMPSASQTSLPSGAVKLVRPSALTRSRTSRTAPFAPPDACWGESWVFSAALAILFLLRDPSGPVPTFLQDRADQARPAYLGRFDRTRDDAFLIGAAAVRSDPVCKLQLLGC